MTRSYVPLKPQNTQSQGFKVSLLIASSTQVLIITPVFPLVLTPAIRNKLFLLVHVRTLDVSNGEYSFTINISSAHLCVIVVKRYSVTSMDSFTPGSELQTLQFSVKLWTSGVNGSSDQKRRSGSGSNWTMVVLVCSEKTIWTFGPNTGSRDRIKQ